MCRLLGIVTASPYEFGLVLREAPRSMAILSREHRDGWGLATHIGTRGYEWTLHRSVLTADEDPFFAAQARRAQGRVLIAHVRQKTIGPLSIVNTHPFHHDDWVFAHNGTVKDLAYVQTHTSPDRLAECNGATDSELFFAYLLTKLDEAGASAEPASRRTDDVVRRAVLEATGRDDFGSVNFLLSNGTTLYVSRFGRPLHLLERTPSDVPCDDAARTCEVPIGQRRCVVVASEPLTDEAWTPIEQGVLLRLEVAPSPHWTTID
jgi:predicted glutamine amidotransferase